MRHTQHIHCPHTTHTHTHTHTTCTSLALHFTALCSHGCLLEVSAGDGAHSHSVRFLHSGLEARLHVIPAFAQVVVAAVCGHDLNCATALCYTLLCSEKMSVSVECKYYIYENELKLCACCFVVVVVVEVVIPVGALGRCV